MYNVDLLPAAISAHCMQDTAWSWTRDGHDKPVDLEVRRSLDLDLASKVAREWNFLLPDQQTGPKKLLDSNAGLPNFSNLR
ncbi:hypothetical protein RRG08_025470 [Elysia crispata]|uniref:Uncharacterized protein n=1 Tax=Elysia crispata TaxID=231223 RepID=A0AAE1DTT6_9GAST|nr:hypothetical protein RRG08_025470 [Elysia crispata]